MDSYVDDLLDMKPILKAMVNSVPNSSPTKTQKTAPHTSSRRLDPLADFIDDTDLGAAEPLEIAPRALSPLPAPCTRLEGVSKVLSDLDLVPVEGMIIDMRLKYMRALSRYGQMILVVLPDKVQGEGETYVPCDEDRLSPSWSSGLLKCVGMTVGGLAFFNSQMRFVSLRTWAGDGMITSTCYQVPGAVPYQEKMYHIYPLVQYADLVTHPMSVSKACVIAYAKINEMNGALVTNMHRSMAQTLKTIEVKFTSDYTRVTRDSSAAVETFVANLIDINNNFNESKDDEENRQRFRLVQLNTFRRMEILDNIRTMQIQFHWAYTRTLTQMSSELDTMVETMNRDWALAVDHLFTEF